MITTPAPTDDPEPVVVVGGGPTGLTAAILLAQFGLPVVILERHHDVYPHPRAVHVDDEVHRILQQVGIGPAFARISRPGAGLRVLDADHAVLATFQRGSTGPHGYPQANMFDQPDLEYLLRDHLADRHPQVTFLRGTEVVDVDPGTATSRPTVTYRRTSKGTADGASWRTARMAATAVLGCDGANSLVRGVIGGRWRDLRFEERWLVVDGRCREPLSGTDTVDQIADPRRAMTFMRVGAERYRWEFRVHDGEDERALRSPQELDRLLAPWLADAPAERFRLQRASAYTFCARVADRWRRDRVFLLGDAAHLTPPFVGQGLGAGLRDAANLGWKLARVVAGAAPEELLDSYEAERRRHVVKQIRLARTVGWVLTGGGGAAAALRREVLRAVIRAPGPAPRLLDRGAPPLRGSSLTRGRRSRGPGSLVGRLVPQPEVDDGGRRRPFDDVLGLRTAILTATTPDPEMLALAVRLGARVLYVQGGGDRETSPPPAGVRTIDAGGTLARWLGDAGASAVVLRPDRVVLAVARSTDRPGRELADSPACAQLLLDRGGSPVRSRGPSRRVR